MLALPDALALAHDAVAVAAAVALLQAHLRAVVVGHADPLEARAPTPAHARLRQRCRLLCMQGTRIVRTHIIVFQIVLLPHTQTETS